MKPSVFAWKFSRNTVKSRRLESSPQVMLSKGSMGNWDIQQIHTVYDVYILKPPAFRFNLEKYDES